MNYNIALINGDGIGPEVTTGAVCVLNAVAAKFGYSFNYTNVTAGGAAIDAFGEPLPRHSLDACKQADAVLMGAIGGEKWDNVDAAIRPEQAILALRAGLKLYANLRPAVLYPQLMNACPLKKEIADNGIDMLIVRELTGGIYFGESGKNGSGDTEAAWDTERYTRAEIKRIAKHAFEAAGKRKKRLLSVDKANVMESSRLWRKVVTETAKDYPDISLSHMYVDNAAMQLIRAPGQFDVILTSNIFGDILSDEASQLTGSIGMLPSASLGETSPGLFEPIHGSAPDIAGQDKANPIAAVLSAAMMLKYAFGLNEAAAAVERAVFKTLEQGLRTIDIACGEGHTIIGTKQMSEVISQNI